MLSNRESLLVYRLLGRARSRVYKDMYIYTQHKCVAVRFPMMGTGCTTLTTHGMAMDNE